jgi:hypothetical protein
MIAVYQTENERMDKKELVLEYNSQLHPKQSGSNKAEMVPTELKTRLRLLSARLAEVALEVEHSSPDQIEEDEALAGLKHEIDLIPLPNRFESTPISYNDYKQNQEKGRWIQKIKTLEKGLELLGQEHLSPEKKAAILRLLKQLSRESVS